jgi:hypothetical protein
VRQGGLPVPAQRHGPDQGQPVEPSLQAGRGRAGAIEKTYEGKTPITYAKLTLAGKAALKEYWKSVDKVREAVRHLKPLRTT